MKTQFDENVLGYRKLPKGNYIVKMKKDDGLDDDCDIKNTLPAVFGAFILGNIRRNMKKFIREINGFYNSSINYGDTDSLRNNLMQFQRLVKDMPKTKNIIKLGVDVFELDKNRTCLPVFSP